MEEVVQIVTEPEIQIGSKEEEDSDGVEVITSSLEGSRIGQSDQGRGDSFIGFESNEQYRKEEAAGNNLDPTDSDEDEDEEELLVFANFNNNLSMKDLKNQEVNIKFIGLDSETPMAEVNGSIFKGSYDYSLGTSVFFDKDTKVSTPHALYEEPCQQMYKYINKTNKVISFNRIYAEKKIEMENNKNDKIKFSGTPAKYNPGNLKTLKSDITYDEAIETFPQKE